MSKTRVQRLRGPTSKVFFFALIRERVFVVLAYTSGQLLGVNDLADRITRNWAAQTKCTNIRWEGMQFECLKSIVGESGKKRSTLRIDSVLSLASVTRHIEEAVKRFPAGGK